LAGRDIVLEALEGDQPEEPGPAAWRLTSAEVTCLDELGVDLEDGYNRNLERLMEVLFGQRFVLQRSKNARHWPQLELINSIIKKVQTFLWTRVTAGTFARDNHSVRDLYERFYRKLVLRDRALPRPWVFTTNYDIFNETAMDRLGIPYANGFTGVVERRFNPASFRYALAEQLDVASRKWVAVDAFVLRQRRGNHYETISCTFDQCNKRFVGGDNKRSSRVWHNGFAHHSAPCPCRKPILTCD
jgi:hypothetical protein